MVLRFSRLFVGTALLAAACSPAPEPIQAIGLPVDAPRVTLIDAGDARELLAFSDVDKAEQSVTVTVTDGFAQTAQPLPEVDEKAPLTGMGGGNEIVLPLHGRTSPAAEAREGQRDATRTPEYSLSSPTIDDQALLPDLRSADGFRAGWRADDAGAPSTVLLSAPDEATDQGRAIAEGALMELISLPVVFPDEKVGLGASWTVDTRVAGDTNVLRTITYTLVALEGDVVELEVAVDERPTLGALSLEGTPGAEGLEDTQLTVDSSHTSSEGTLTVDLEHALPVAGQVAFTTRVVYAGENDQAIVQDSATSISFGS